MKHLFKKIAIGFGLVFTMGLGVVSTLAHSEAAKPVAAYDTIDVYFTSPGWAASYSVHYWGGSASTEWPGDSMTATYQNDIHETVFKAAVPADSSGIIFNGAGNQTINIEGSEIANNRRYWITGLNTGNKYNYGYETLSFYTISFDGNGADSGSMDNYKGVVNGNCDLPYNHFSKDGYMFVGWNTDRDGDGNAYSNCQTIVPNTFAADANITLYAQWVECIRVYFTQPDSGWDNLCVHYWGGSAESSWPGDGLAWGYVNNSHQTVYYGDVPFDSTGIIFNNNNNGKQTVNITSNIVNKKGFYTTGVIDGEGHYEVGNWNVGFYSVHYESNGGTGSMDDSTGLVYDVDQQLAMNQFTYDGHYFTGWNTQSDGSGDGYSNSDIVPANTCSDGETLTLYAQWDTSCADGVYMRGSFSGWKADGQYAMTKVNDAEYYVIHAFSANDEMKMCFVNDNIANYVANGSCWSLDSIQYPVHLTDDANKNLVIEIAATYKIRVMYDNVEEHWNYEVAAVEAVDDGAYLRGDWANGWTTPGQVDMSKSGNVYTVSGIALSASGTIKMVVYTDGIVSWCNPNTVTGTTEFPATKVGDNIVVTNGGTYSITVTYSEGNWNYSLVGSLDPSLDIAEDFADGFNTAIEAVCIEWGKTDPDALADAWKNQKDLYDAITDPGALEYLATIPGTSTILTKFAAKYDKVYSLYQNAIDFECGGHEGDGNFLNRAVIGGAPLITNFVNDSSNLILVVAIVSVASITAIGGFFYIRKRRNEK